MQASNRERFYLVWNATRQAMVERHSRKTSADDAAIQKAKESVGELFIVFEPSATYQASAIAERVLLAWPSYDDEPDVAEPPAKLVTEA